MPVTIFFSRHVSETRFLEFVTRRNFFVTEVNKMSKPSKTWKWTLNNFTEKDLELHKLWSEDCKRMRAATEVGKSGTPHIQAAATFNRAMRLSALKKMHPRVHWEPAKVDDMLYEAKLDGEVFINIDNRKQGERSDLTDLANDIHGKMSKRKLWEKHPEAMIKFFRGAYEMMKVVNLPKDTTEFTLADYPNWTPFTDWSKSHILWGPAGLGKTNFALAHFRNGKLITDIDDLKDFDPSEHDGLVFDDMCFLHIPENCQIHIVDITNNRSIRCRNSNGFIPAYTKKIFCTNAEDGAIVQLGNPAIARRVTVTEVTER